MNLAERISVNTRYTRSINVERDRCSRGILEAYLPSAGCIELLSGISDTFDDVDQPRAWSLVGPYGSGKSSFALFLHELLGTGPIQAAAREILAKESPVVAERFSGEANWCRVVLSGGDEPIATRLVAALDDAATSFWRDRPGRKPAVLGRIRHAREHGGVTDSDLLEVVAELQNSLESAGGGGLLLLIDELGKFLEYEARHEGRGIFLLQQLAEHALRGRRANLVIVVFLHQGFDLYARGLGQKHRDDWAKVQGRFQTVSFIEPATQVLRLVAAALSNTLTATESLRVTVDAGQFAKVLATADALPSGMDAAIAADLFAQCDNGVGASGEGWFDSDCGG